jgi:hypothetical protein
LSAAAVCATTRHDALDRAAQSAELNAGLMTDASILASMRWIPKSMTVDYLAKASGTVHAVAPPEALPVDAAEGYAWPAPVSVRNGAGEAVFGARIGMWLSPPDRQRTGAMPGA